MRGGLGDAAAAAGGGSEGREGGAENDDPDGIRIGDLLRFNQMMGNNKAARENTGGDNPWLL
jgi:hypothetical protein